MTESPFLVSQSKALDLEKYPITHTLLSLTYMCTSIKNRIKNFLIPSYTRSPPPPNNEIKLGLPGLKSTIAFRQPNSVESIARF